MWTKTIQLLEVNLGLNQHDIKFGNGFLDMKSKVWATKDKIHKLVFIKKCLCFKVHYQENEETQWGKYL